MNIQIRRAYDPPARSDGYEGARGDEEQEPPDEHLSPPEDVTEGARGHDARRTDQQVGIVEVFRRWSGRQEPTQHCGGGFRIAFFNEVFGLVQDRRIVGIDSDGIRRFCLASLNRHEEETQQKRKNNGDR